MQCMQKTNIVYYSVWGAISSVFFKEVVRHTVRDVLQFNVSNEIAQIKIMFDLFDNRKYK